MISKTLLIASVALLTCSYSTDVSAADGQVQVVHEWSGKIVDKTLRQQAPKSGVIQNTKQWELLWKVWRSQEKAPTINFEKQLVVVGTVPGPNRAVMSLTIDESGDVRVFTRGTRIGGPGFGYQMVVIDKNGVNSINGNPLTREKLTGELVIPAGIDPFVESLLEVKLWEYDPVLADAAAKVVDEFQVKNFGHFGNNETKVPFELGEQVPIQQNRRYYVTAFVLKQGKRTHIGERIGKPGLCKVLNGGNPSQIKLIARKVD